MRCHGDGCKMCRIGKGLRKFGKEFQLATIHNVLYCLYVRMHPMLLSLRHCFAHTHVASMQRGDRKDANHWQAMQSVIPEWLKLPETGAGAASLE